MSSNFSNLNSLHSSIDLRMSTTQKCLLNQRGNLVQYLSPQFGHIELTNHFKSPRKLDMRSIIRTYLKIGTRLIYHLK